MKLTFVIVLLLILAGCKDSGTGPKLDPVPLGEAFQLKYGQELILEGGSATVQFFDVGADSRCPIDVICVWEGNAAISLHLESAVGPSTFVLNTADQPHSVTVGAYTIGLKEVTPFPISTRTIDKKDYVITLLVSRE